MEKYSSYKDSGVKWLGEIPSHWEVVSIKKISNIILGKMLENAPDDQGFPYLCAKDVHFDGVSYDDLKKMLFSENEKKKYIVKKGDLLVVEGGAGGTCAIIDKDIDDVYIQNSLMIVRGFPNKVSNNYIFYALSSLVKRGYADSVCNKATILHFTKEKLESTNIALAPLCEQIKIINYLDTVTSQIDVAISQQKKMIELLNERKQIIINNAVTKGLDPNVKMKDSGVDWIGEIPEGWEVQRLRFLCKIKTGDKDTINRIDDGKYPFYVRSPKVERINSYTFDGEAVLMAGDGVGAGKIFHYVNGKFGCHQRVYILHDIRKVKGEFLYYYMLCKFPFIIEQLSAKSTVDSVRLNMLQDCQVVIPCIEEQNRILSNLRIGLSKMDSAIESYNRLISLLQERKQIIINEVVTGKVKVS